MTSLEATAIWTAPLFLQLSLTCSQHWSTQVFEVLKWAISLRPNTWSITLICIVLQDPPLPPPLSSTASLSVSTRHTRVGHTSMDARIKSLPVSSNIPAQTDWPLLPVDRQGEEQSWRHLWGSSCRKSKAWLSLRQSSHRNRQHRSFPFSKLRDAFLLQIK